KTTALLERMVALVATGTASIDEIAVVTFTRKAAAELAEGFQIALEEGLRRCRINGDAELAERLDRALRDRDRGFVGTIHAFCGRLLRERPIEAGLDPAFRELVGPELEEHRRRFWERWMDQAYGGPDPALAALAEVGLSPNDLVDAFRSLDDNLDIEFPAELVERPDSGPIRATLAPLLDGMLAIMPRHEPPDGWDRLQTIVRGFRWLRESSEWLDDARFFDSIAPLIGWGSSQYRRPTWNRWSSSRAVQDRIRELNAALEDFGRPGGLAAETLDRWFAHRYPIALDFSRRAAAAYAEERRRAGRLTFNDLLVLTVGLLRESPSARRDLARRWSWLLVDEFQDTDPVQAEIVFLLTADDPAEREWTRATPRPGALFVVGDPKQSIYRFRRADIAVYRTVRQKFEALAREAGPHGRPLGDIVGLDANFRSRPSIERFVDDEFARRFPVDATDAQAAFAPLRVQRPGADAVRGEVEGVWCYEIDPANPQRHAVVAAEDAARVAGWIDARIRAGERKPGDFLILPYHRKFLAAYAEALEARNIPVQVTGSDLVIEEELGELRLLLEALADPSDESLAVAVLVGLFFGLDYECLVAHALAGGSFRIAGAPPGDSEGPVVEALDRLRDWWRLVRSTPADVSVPTIVEELGLLPYAAASGLGAARAGAIGYIMEVIRKIGIEGDTSLRGAIEAIEVALQLGEAEAPLEPLREDAVRIMNLHKAKGTEAPVVVLAAPTGVQDFPIGMRVERTAAGSAIGWLEIRSKQRSQYSAPVVARPLDWSRHQVEEQRFKAAERDRLLYVAATRARDELLVGRCRKCERQSFWLPLYPCLERSWPLHALDGAAPRERRRLERPVEAIVAEAEAAREARMARKAPSYTAVAASVLAKAGREQDLMRGAGGRGREWGSAVHAALEAALRGLDGEALRLACRTSLVGNARDVGAEGEPKELEELVALVEAIAGSDLFARARATPVCLPEVPFAWRREVDGEVQIVEGVIDLAFREEGGWVLVDWKTDEIALAVREEAYNRQLGLYAEAWQALTGERVVARDWSSSPPATKRATGLNPMSPR
ncbi:MAG: UvrD-helicase domain-containing protein, partial [Candidatus Limnocylindria bacterium]